MVASARAQRSVVLPELPRDRLAHNPFLAFDDWLDEVETELGQRTALLTLDEFEVLDDAFTKHRFDEAAVLGTLRSLVQQRTRFKLLLAGSHTLDELRRWSSYLINVQVLHLSYLNLAEAHRLVEQPVKDSALRYEPDATQRVLDLTRGHPFLVQLLCREVVDIKNQQLPSDRRLARLSDVEAAVEQAFVTNPLFFFDICNQIALDGVAVLRFMAASGERATTRTDALQSKFPNELQPVLDMLMRRELIEPRDDGFGFQVELIRRWFADYAPGPGGALRLQPQRAGQ
jgi:hypothetical protein